ncbi:Mu transposase C-terminal domain-containing protein [Roseateles cellulosilyticus]|uniref:DDE-type integrase/transposase/recombinase n=1 Tax=Pelomonas cellulosilytica TaxID=2906762 RepID=A0ABS8XYN4_9BURK|nr:DDE-type integrase/transposase/recombinase [Pelomonas sp. P8]
MATRRFEKDASFRIDGIEFVMRRKLDAEMWQIEETKTGRLHQKSESELRHLYVDGRLSFTQEDASYKGAKIGKVHREVAQPLMERAKVRRSYAVEAAKGPSSETALRDVAARVWAKIGKPATPPHWTTVSRWKAKLLSAGMDINAVVAQNEKKGNRTERYEDRLIEFVENAIEKVYLTKERKTIQDTIDAAVTAVRRENKLRPEEDQLPLPQRRLVKRLINEISAFDRCQARYGREAAVRRYRSVQRHRTTDGPLVRAEIDHTVLDIMVVDDTTGLPLGRPLLTACIDDFTRCVLGISIGFEPASYLTVARCLKHAFLPKLNTRADYPEVVQDWDAHGVMQELCMDNGAEFHSDSLETACLTLGIEIHYAPRKTPWFKGKIERFLGTLNSSLLHGAPGTTFSNIFEKDDYDPSKHAVVRLSTLRHIVMKWIVDVYHERPHRSLKVPPAQLWRSSVALEDIQLPDDPAQLDAILGRRVQRSLSHKGIELDGLFYNSPELTTLRRELGERLEVEICINDGDIGSITVLSPDKKRMFVAPALALSYAKGMTAWQHKVCKRHAALQLGKHDSAGWQEAKTAIAEMIHQEFNWKKKTKPRGTKAPAKSAKRVGRYITGSSSSPAVQSAPADAGAALPTTSVATCPSTGPNEPVESPPTAPAMPPIPMPTKTLKFAPVKRQRQESTWKDEL